VDVPDGLVLAAAGLAAGTVNALAGGGSLITFPTLVAVGLPPVPANVTNSLAVTPGYLASVFASRADLAALAARRNLYAFVPTAVAGSALGCLLLLVTPARAFDLIVPFLVLAATAVLAFQQRIRQVVGHPHELGPRRQTLALHGIIALGAAYGGYFGAALGIMLVAGLGLVLAEPMAAVNALKNAVSAVVAVVTVVAYGVFGPVNWAAVAVIAPASMLGGYLGARVARRLPASALRTAIVAVGSVVSVILLIRAVS
jgi:uncharacterized membrane protein YfcA